MSAFENAVRGLSRAQQARVAVNWKSERTTECFAWHELRAAELMSAIAVPAAPINEATWDRIWLLLSEELQKAAQRGFDDAINQSGLIAHN